MIDNTANPMTGVQRAAVLLLSLGEADAAEVLRHMEPKEVQKIGIAMATSDQHLTSTGLVSGTAGYTAPDAVQKRTRTCEIPPGCARLSPPATT